MLLALRFNKTKTVKIGKLYDELNLTASDYTVYIDINSAHREEFDRLYVEELYNPYSSNSRGLLFKKYVKDKLSIEDLNIARIDLVFDNKHMIELLEGRGHAMKLQNLK